MSRNELDTMATKENTACLAGLELSQLRPDALAYTSSTVKKLSARDSRMKETAQSIEMLSIHSTGMFSHCADLISFSDIEI